jgi:glucokinase
MSGSESMILAGDVGGTKVNLGLFEIAGAGFPHAVRHRQDPRAPGPSWASLPPRPPRIVAAASFASQDFAGLAEVAAAFLRQLPPAAAGGGRQLAAACFGVAGPVIGNRASTPNLAWEIDGRALGRALGVREVRLINDLVATAEGLPLLAAGEVAPLQAGAGGPGSASGPGSEGAPGISTAAGTGNQVLIAAGTGLGMALLPVIGGERVVVPSEGGHADYAARDDDEAALLRYLRRRFGEHVSVERVVSGPGLGWIYEHLRDAGHAPESAAVRAALAAGDPARVIAEAALGGGDPLCGRALDMFVAAYGAAAGNLALIGTAVGGVYIGGGIAPKILPRLTGGGFVRAFRDKGRFAAYLESIPIWVVLNDRAAMLGAARCAAAMATVGAETPVPALPEP